MAARLSLVLKQIRKAATAENAERFSDRQLVERFVAERDETAFARLVQRHGAMVMNVCWRVLQNDSDVDDACQATFMVLARRASSIRKKDAVASWLHGVAYRAASNLRKEIMRRQAREGKVASQKSGTKSEVTWRDVQTALDEEIQRLPEELQGPVLLCYLEGKTHNEAAQQLGWSLSTLRGRLERAREVLRKRLTQRGVTLSGALLAAVLSGNIASAALSASYSSNLLTAALASETVNGIVSAQVLSLAQGVIQAMFWSKVKVSIVLALLTVITVGLAGLGIHGLAGGGHAQEAADGLPTPGARRGSNLDANTSTVISHGEKQDPSEKPKTGTNAKARVQLPDGAIVEMLGVGQHPTDGGVWWEADGTPLAKPIDTLSQLKEPHFVGQILRELAIQVHKPATASADLFATFGGFHATSGTNENLRIRTSMSVPKSMKEFTIKLGYAGGAWKTTADADNKGTTKSKDVRFLPIERMPDGRIVVTIQHAMPDLERQIVVIDNAGKRHVSFGNSRQHTGAALKDEGMFDLTIDEINRVVLETRRYTWVEFRHVSLDPAHRTRVEVWVDGKRQDRKSNEKVDAPDQPLPQSNTSTTGKLPVDAETEPKMGPGDEKKMLTPDQVFRDKVEGAVRIEFTIKAVTIVGSPFVMEEATDRVPIVTEQGKEVSRLQVILTKKAEARLNQLGIEDVRSHFYGKLMRVSGILKRMVDGNDKGNRLITYQLSIDNLEQLESVGPSPTKLPLGLEFLAPFPEFHEIRFGQDEATIRTIAKRHVLNLQGPGENGGFTVSRKDGETLALSMRDGKCSGIQRLGASR